MPAWTFVKTFKTWVKPLVFLLCSIPICRLVWLGFNHELTANPIEFITRSTGTWGLVMLCITLSVTPVRQLTQWNWLLPLRRMFGLFCFFYALLHFLIWSVIDNGLDLNAIYQDFYKRTFITLGLAAFILLIPLAATSTKKMQRRLGRNWAKLHQLVYLIAILVPLHYWVHKAGKNNFGTVKIYIAILAALLGWRLFKWIQRKSQIEAI